MGVALGMLVLNMVITELRSRGYTVDTASMKSSSGPLSWFCFSSAEKRIR